MLGQVVRDRRLAGGGAASAAAGASSTSVRVRMLRVCGWGSLYVHELLKSRGALKGGDGGWGAHRTDFHICRFGRVWLVVGWASGGWDGVCRCGGSGGLGRGGVSWVRRRGVWRGWGRGVRGCLGGALCWSGGASGYNPFILVCFVRSEVGELSRDFDGVEVCAGRVPKNALTASHEIVHKGRVDGFPLEEQVVGSCRISGAVHLKFISQVSSHLLVN